MQDDQDDATINLLKMQIRQRLDKYVSLKEVAYNPDADIVDQLLTGLAQREHKYNRAYCPCRRPTGDTREDAKIICPCFYSKEEMDLQEMTMAENVTELTDDTFDEVLQSDIPYLVDFWAEWCPPCKMVEPVVAKIAVQYKGKLKVGRVDTDQAQRNAIIYGINAIPTLIIFKDGKPAKRILGYRKFEDLKKEVDEVV